MDGLSTYLFITPFDATDTAPVNFLVISSGDANNVKAFPIDVVGATNPFTDENTEDTELLIKSTPFFLSDEYAFDAQPLK